MPEDVKTRSDKWSSVQFTVPTGGLIAGAMYQVGALVGVVVETRLVGEAGVLIYRCEKIVLPKTAATGVDFTVGKKVYYNNTTKKVTDVVTTGNVLIGRALEVAADAATELLVDLEGSVAA